MDDYKKRLIDEYHELKEKYGKLCSFIERVEEGSSPIHDDYPVSELYEQQVAMEAYLDALSARLAYEGVET